MLTLVYPIDQIRTTGDGRWGRHALLPYLTAPPAITWAFHIALLRATARHDLPLPQIHGIREIDTLDIQQALAGLAANRRA